MRTPSSAIARVSATFRPHGFSHRIGSPCSASAETTGTWSRVGTATRKPSTGGSESSVARGASIAAAASSDGSTTQATSTPVDEASARACVAPMRPAPIRPSRYATSGEPMLDERAVPLVGSAHRRHVVERHRDAILLDHAETVELANLGQRKELLQRDDARAELAEDPE